MELQDWVKQRASDMAKRPRMFAITKEDIDYMLAKIPANTSVHIELITDGTEPPPITIIASTL